MWFDFDPQKDAGNLSKLCFSLAAAAQLNRDAALVWIDDWAAYGEVRIVALTPMEDTLLFVAFVDRSLQGEFLLYVEQMVERSTTMSKPSKKINLKMPTVEGDQLITAAAESDPDALPLTDKQIERMVPMRVCVDGQSWQIKRS